MWVKTWRRCRREMCRDLGENRVGKKPKQRPKGWRVLVCLGDCLLLSFWNSGVETTSGVTQRATAGSRPQRRSRAGRVPKGGNVRARMCRDAEECVCGHDECWILRTRRRGIQEEVGTPQWHSVFGPGDRTHRETREAWGGNRERLLMGGGGRFAASLPHCRQILYQLSHEESPVSIKMLWKTSKFQSTFCISLLATNNSSIRILRGGYKMKTLKII